MRARQIVSVVLVTLLLVFIAALASAQYGDYGPPATETKTGSKADTQLKTAIDHAKNSAGSNTVNTAVTHLGHVLNCIEGTKGKNFNASWDHVCQGQGDGILTDIKSAKNANAVTLVLDAANDLAVAGVKARDLAAVQYAARGVGALLQVVADAIR